VQPGKKKLSLSDQNASVKTALINLAVGAVVLLVASQFFGIRSSIPFGFVEIIKLAVMFFVSDTLFYWSHRLMHKWKWLYRTAHSKHHSHTEPTPWTSLFVHPIEFLIALVCIFIVPLLIFNMNPLTVTLFLSGIMVSLVASHSGLKLGPFGWDASHHDMHHRKPVGNFGSDVGIWDYLMGTRIKTTSSSEA
jgi:sterol desaturase/sphingolipid hydroxylase (fatty acid hydroxylase superfamily)